MLYYNSMNIDYAIRGIIWNIVATMTELQMFSLLKR